MPNKYPEWKYQTLNEDRKEEVHILNHLIRFLSNDAALQVCSWFDNTNCSAYAAVKHVCGQEVLDIVHHGVMCWLDSLKVKVEDQNEN